MARDCHVSNINNPTTDKDFRPISILPVLSKMYETVILKQLSNYIERTSIYNSTQLKFRDDIQKPLNKNTITVVVFLDYSKAFDTIRHETLIKKLAQLSLAT